MERITAEITANREFSRDYLEMRFRLPPGTAPLPGQFLTIRISDGPAPLLRRPFAFSGFSDGTAGIIYQRRGPGTEMLAGKRPGTSIDIIAPLGNAWPEPAAGETAVLAAGGIGLGPILFFARSLKRKGIPARLIIGARSGDFLPAEADIEGLDALLATDDGSRGIRGTVLDALPGDLPDAVHYYACGPEPMIRAVHRKAVAEEAPCHISMEQTMACGVGACMGCVIPTAAGGYTRVCADGPIFESRELAWT